MTQQFTLPHEREAIRALSMKDHLDDLIEINTYFTQKGIDTNNTRIARYISYLQLAANNDFDNAPKIFKNSLPGPFEHSTDWLLYILREVHELMWIMKGIKISEPKGILDKLKLLVSGSDFAVLDTDTISRDTQFELRIASYFCQYGCFVDLSTGTDIVAHFDKNCFYIECKRVGNINKLNLRAKEAKKQLLQRVPKRVEKKTILCCVALDVTKVAFPHNGLAVGSSSILTKLMLRNKLIKISDDLSNFMELPGPKHPTFCWLQIHIPTFMQSVQQGMTRFSSYQLQYSLKNRKLHGAHILLNKIFEGASFQIDNRSVSISEFTKLF